MACVVFLLTIPQMHAQRFKRSELSAVLDVPWEMIYGPDGMLWLSESKARIVRVDPQTGGEHLIYTASDYFGGSPMEACSLCTKPSIGAGTMGMALDPDFTAGRPFIYLFYSYNSGTAAAPSTRFKVRRISWNPATEQVVGDSDIVLNIPTGFDHLGGRLLAVKRKGVSYLYISVGDHGVSETNTPGCYEPASANPNFQAQNPATLNGKILRVLMDGSIPVDNPIAGSPVYTRGHRNPQGFAYDEQRDVLYEIEHGDRTDDEINVLVSGHNYGWKNVRGYTWDNNEPGEAEFVASYKPNSGVTGDSLHGALYSFCAVKADTTSDGKQWCTIAPSDGLFYHSNAIPELTNSILLVTLKEGVTTAMEMYCLHLDADGTPTPSTSSHPNPSTYFGADQKINGRLRDIAIAPDGRTIYLINNFGADRDKITVYTLVSDAVESNTTDFAPKLQCQYEATTRMCTITVPMIHYEVVDVDVYSLTGSRILHTAVRSGSTSSIDCSTLTAGVYTVHAHGLGFEGTEILLVTGW